MLNYNVSRGMYPVVDYHGNYVCPIHHRGRHHHHHHHGYRHNHQQLPDVQECHHRISADRLNLVAYQRYREQG